MRGELRRGGAAALLAALLAGALLLVGVLGLGSAAAEDPTDTPSPKASTATPTGPLEVADAVLRWGVNVESSSAAFFGRNFFSAGKLPNRGSGVNVTQADWSAQSGQASVEQYSATANAYQPATWTGVTTGAAGSQQVVLAGGSGSVDPDTGAASIRWTGSFTVVYYSGLSFFYVTDPVLSVANGRATLTATLSGFGTSQSDTSQWLALTPAQGTLADLGDVDLSGDGFTATPAYRGVSVTTPSGAAGQVRTGVDWGAFPQSFVDFQAGTGLSSYWYSSGASTDAGKVALPVTVSYDASKPVTVPTPSPSASGVTVTNSAIPQPSPTPTATVTTQVTVAAPAALLPSAPPPAAAVVQAAAASAVQPARTVLALSSAESTVPSSTRWPWFAGALALLLAAGLVVGTFRPRDESRNIT